MVNDFNVTIEWPVGKDRDLDVVAEHRHPKGYGIKGADAYSITDCETNTYLGFIVLVNDTEWTFTGEGLAEPEQEQVVEFIRNFEDFD